MMTTVMMILIVMAMKTGKKTMTENGITMTVMTRIIAVTLMIV